MPAAVDLHSLSAFTNIKTSSGTRFGSVRTLTVLGVTLIFKLFLLALYRFRGQHYRGTQGGPWRNEVYSARRVRSYSSIRQFCAYFALMY